MHIQNILSILLFTLAYLTYASETRNETEMQPSKHYSTLTSRRAARIAARNSLASNKHGKSIENQSSKELETAKTSSAVNTASWQRNIYLLKTVVKLNILYFLLKPLNPKLARHLRSFSIAAFATGLTGHLLMLNNSQNSKHVPANKDDDEMEALASRLEKISEHVRDETK